MTIPRSRRRDDSFGGMSNCVWLYYLLRLRHSQRLKLILQVADMILLRDDFIGLIMSDKPHNKNGNNEPNIYHQIWRRC